MGTPGPRERLLDATIASLRRDGVEGTGIAGVLAASGTARQSIYQHFPGGKAELVAAAVRRAGDHITGRGLDDPRAHVDDLIDWWIGQLERHDFALGCPVAAGALAGKDSPAVVAAAAEVFADWSSGFGDRLEAAGGDPARSAVLGRFLVSSLEGAIMTARALRTVDPLEDLRAIWHRLIDDLLPH